MSTDWTSTRRIAFRFGVVYLTLFCLVTQISGSLLPNPWFTYRGLGRLSPIRDVTHWVARSFFAINVRLDDVSGGETVFFWIQWAWIIAAAVGGTVIWSLIGRRRNYTSWLPWVRLAIRLALAASMIEYGMTKVIPTQFPAPPLVALVTPVGDMSLSGMLWTTIGSAPAYEIATGCLEVLGGVLLLLPWTVTLGALLGLISITQVLLLNLTFDIGVKVVTTHLVAMAALLLVPMVRLSTSADAAAVKQPDTTLVVRLKADTTGRAAVILPIVVGVWLLGIQTWINWSFWHVGGGGRPKSVLYGIWNVEQLSVDGKAGPAQSNDYDRRWRRVIFDEPDGVVFQRTDDSFARYGASIDRGNGTIVLVKGGSRTWTARFIFDRAGGDRLSLSGEMDGHRIEAALRRVDSSELPLLNSTFRWIRPHDP